MIRPTSARKSRLLSVAEAAHLDQPTIADLYRHHVSPGQWSTMSLLGFDQLIIDHARGVYYFDRDGTPILDFFGGFGVLALGHNHPRLLAARHRFQQEQRHELALVLPSQYVAALSHNLAAVAPAGLDRVSLYSTGSEAVEAALKLAERAQGPRRAGIAYTDCSFHGKTVGALSVTDSAHYRDHFTLPRQRYRVPFGDAETLERTLRTHPEIGTVISETVQGGAGVVLPPPGYLATVRRLCDRHNVVWVADEVQCGLGRTGRFFAFDHAGVAPDVVTLAKALGGGKAAISAVLARREIHDRAYGTARTCLIHGPSTFSGMGEACCTAIETLGLLDEDLLDNATVQGEYLLRQLEWLRHRHRRLIRDVRGLGLMVAVEFADISTRVPGLNGRLAELVDKPLQGGLAALIGSQLAAEFGILIGFTEYNRNVVRLEPPLIIGHHHVDMLITALDTLLSRGLRGLITGYLHHRCLPKRAEPETVRNHCS